jgi:uncharacterized protein (DUF1684 family)
MNFSEWKERIELERKQKDEFFWVHSQSPIPFEERENFKGLDYYSPDFTYRFELELHEHSEKETLKIEDTSGNEREFFRWGEFRFQIGGKECTLQAYKSNLGEERLFVPFRDATSDKETYGAGRYLDLNPEEHYTAEGKWILDFNKAYNPWCAYSKFYACPFVPPENWLEVPVCAGEKNYPAKKEI